MKKVTIKETKRCDTRALAKNFTEEDVKKDTIAHIAAVQNVTASFASALIDQVANHDSTKLGEYLPMFTRALKTKFKDDEFKKLNWWKIHKRSERHHLNDYCPDDVNLIDVIEMLIDCVCAGLARTGNVYPIEISDNMLQKAVANTVAMLKESIEIEKE